MRQRSRAERGAMFRHINGDGALDHLKSVIKVKQLEKEIQTPILFKKKNKFAEVNQEAAYVASTMGMWGPTDTTFAYDRYAKNILDIDPTNNTG